MSDLGHGGRGSAIDTSFGQGPGTIDQQTFTSSQYLDLSSIVLPLAKNKPRFTIPITERTQSIDAWDPNSVNPYIQSVNFSITRQVGKGITADVRYVGTKATKLYGSAPLLDQMLRGLNLNPGVAGFWRDRNSGERGSSDRLDAPAPEHDVPRQYRQRELHGVANSLNSSTAVTGLGGGLIRNGGLPENFIVNNPQFNNVTLTTIQAAPTITPCRRN